MKNRINVFFSINNLLFEVVYVTYKVRFFLKCDLYAVKQPNTQMYSGALSGTEKMLATDELDQPY
jgi:hypothetical protein